jgi:hypothetical protein
VNHPYIRSCGKERLPLKRRSNNHKSKTRFNKNKNNEPRRKKPRNLQDKRANKYGVPILMDEENEER